MNLKQLFARKKDTRALGHLQNLLIVAQSDSCVDKVEYDYIESVAHRYRVSARDLKCLRKQEGGVVYEVPESSEERFQHLYDYLYVMMADREVDHREMKQCEAFAQQLGFSKAQVSELVYSIEQNIIAGNNPRETLKRVQHLIG
jgi:uncharacterized tellurite resistance protein B-like protein